MRGVLVLFSILCLSAADDAVLQEFTKANNLFAGSIYQEIAKSENGNFLVSPFSAETVLSLALSGSEGQTADELRTALHLPNDKEKIESALKTLLPKFKDNNLYSLYTANKIYIKNNFLIKDKFKDVSSSIYQTDIETVNFTKNVEVGGTINKWVEQHTNEKIKDLINSDDLDKFTRAVLINALYFKANWSNPFLLTSTSPKDFYRSASDVVKVDTLYHYEKSFNYYECPHLEAQFLELPFKGGEATMVIVLPNQKEGLPALEKQLEQVFSPKHKLESTFLNVALPKFHIETSIDFKEVLEKLGVKKLFEETEADLSGIAGNPGDLFVKKAAQKTFIDVNEEGVEAAAATYVLVSIRKSAIYPRPKDFIADHPFIFYIKINDVIIFAGRVTDPSKP